MRAFGINHSKVYTVTLVFLASIVLGIYWLFTTFDQVAFFPPVVYLLFHRFAYLYRNVPSVLEVHEHKLVLRSPGRLVELPWTEVRRIEFRKVLWFRSEERIVVHGLNQEIVVDWNRQDYLEAWTLIVDRYLQATDMGLVDQDLYPRLLGVNFSTDID